MNKEVDISQMTLTIEVGEGVISQVRATRWPTAH